MAAVPSTGRADQADRVAAPEADATRALYERYANQIFGYCLHQLGSREEAEDAVQSTFLNAFRGLRRGVVPELESAWLFKIAHNVCLSRRRSSWRRGRIESPADFDVVEEMAPAPQRRADELIGLQDVLETMPENQRRAILLREWQGLSYREIADELDLSQAAVETLIFRARRSLAQGLEQPPKSLRARIRAAGDFGNILAGIKSLLFSGAAAVKVAATVAVVSATTVAVTAPVQQHRQHHARRVTQSAAASSSASSSSSKGVPLVASPVGGLLRERNVARKHGRGAGFAGLGLPFATTPTSVGTTADPTTTTPATTQPASEPTAPAPSAPAPAPSAPAPVPTPQSTPTTTPAATPTKTQTTQGTDGTTPLSGGPVVPPSNPTSTTSGGGTTSSGSGQDQSSGSSGSTGTSSGSSSSGSTQAPPVKPTPVGSGSGTSTGTGTGTGTGSDSSPQQQTVVQIVVPHAPVTTSPGTGTSSGGSTTTTTSSSTTSTPATTTTSTTITTTTVGHKSPGSTGSTTGLQGNG